MVGLRTGLLSLSAAVFFAGPLLADIAPFPIRTAWPRQLAFPPVLTIVAGLFLSAAIIAFGLRLQRRYSPRITWIAVFLALLVLIGITVENVRAYYVWQRFEQRGPRGPLPPQPPPASDSPAPTDTAAP